jgi:hypothetical protein
MKRTVVQQLLHYFARPHEGPARAPVGGPSAWRGAEMAARDDWRVTLGPDEVRELLDAVAAASAGGRPLRDMTRDDLPLPTLGPRIARWRAEIARGRGFLVIRGVPVERWSQAECERFFWGFGQHLGIPGAQNPAGDLLGHVRDQGYGDQTEVRAYRTRTRIEFHCDAADAVGLLCLRRAARGGQSRIASSVAVHDELLRRRPDLIAGLYEPFLLDTKSEGGLRWFPVAPCRFAGGRLRTFYHADYFRSVERHPGAPPLSPRKRELLDVYDAIAGSPDFYLEMDLDPGDVQLLSNHTVIHARAAFEDGDAPDQRRHLLRLWLSLPGADGAGGAWGPYLQLLSTLGAERLRQGLHAVRARGG